MMASTNSVTIDPGMAKKPPANGSNSEEKGQSLPPGSKFAEVFKALNPAKSANEAGDKSGAKKNLVDLTEHKNSELTRPKAGQSLLSKEAMTKQNLVKQDQSDLDSGTRETDSISSHLAQQIKDEQTPLDQALTVTKTIKADSKGHDTTSRSPSYLESKVEGVELESVESIRRNKVIEDVVTKPGTEQEVLTAASISSLESKVEGVELENAESSRPSQAIEDVATKPETEQEALTDTSISQPFENADNQVKARPDGPKMDAELKSERVEPNNPTIAVEELSKVANADKSATVSITSAAANLSAAEKQPIPLAGANPVSNATTSWASQNDLMQVNANAGQGAQSSGSGQQQSGQAFSHAQQQLMLAQQFQQTQQKISQAIEQQFNLKLNDEAALKSDSRELLMGGELMNSERRTQLPPGLQTISQPLKHPQWGQALGQRVVFMATNQLQQAQITLNPEKLGPIQVKMHVDRDQQVHITLQAQHLTTRETMTEAMPRLKEMLEQSGLSLASVDVEDFSQAQTGGEESSNQSSGQAKGTGQDTPDDAEGTTSVRIAETNNLVDYYA